MSGAEMMEVLLDLEPDAAVQAAARAPWELEPGPGNDTALVLDALGGLAGQVAHHAGALASVLVHPQRLVADVRTELGALLALRDVASSTPPTPMDGPITPHRRWAWATAELDDQGHQGCAGRGPSTTSCSRHRRRPARLPRRPRRRPGRGRHQVVGAGVGPGGADEHAASSTTGCRA
ncbi:MAG: wax ester/triacylglycerol synthase family O-acyltransferase [Acidimicrobiales bacterium]